MMNLCLTTKEIQSRLQSAGVGATVQRIAVAQYILCQADHPTADQIFEWAQQKLGKISLATVYNTVEALEKAGLIRKLKFPFTDKIMFDGNVKHHHHFFDQKTGKVIDIDAQDIEMSFKASPGLKNFKVNSYEVLLHGELKTKRTKNIPNL